ncbi:hypothetical protein BDV12DRAFT_168129 [Aspergillus spectabilis]
MTQTVMYAQLFSNGYKLSNQTSSQLALPITSSVPNSLATDTSAYEERAFEFSLETHADKTLSDTTYTDRKLREVLNTPPGRTTDGKRGFIYSFNVPTAPGFSRIRRSAKDPIRSHTRNATRARNYTAASEFQTQPLSKGSS